MQYNGLFYSDILNGHKSYRKFKSVETELKNLGIHVITIKDLVCLLNNSRILYYDKNRGNTGIIENHVERIVDEFDPESLGQISLVYLNKQKCFMSIDGSHRLTALCEMAKSGALDDHWTTAVAVKVFEDDDRLSAYQNINSGLKHSRLNTLSNSELVYGKLIGQLVSLAASQSGLDASYFPPKYYKILAYLMYGVYENRELREAYIHDWSFENVWSVCSKRASIDFIKPIPRLANCSIHDLGCLVDGIVVVMDYTNALGIKKKTFEKEMRKIISDPHTRKRQVTDAFSNSLTNTSVIGYLLCAGVRNVHRLGKSEDYIEEICSRNTRISKMSESLRGMSDRVKLMNFLDKSIFGVNFKRNTIRYWPK